MKKRPSLLDREIQQRRPFSGPAEEAYLNLQRTASLQLQELSRFLRGFGVTPTQYNALRILRGAHPEPLACGEVGRRMVTPVPDVTRLLDRLESSGYVLRGQDSEDRRVVTGGVTAKGLALLAEIDDPLVKWLEEAYAPLSDDESSRLTSLLEKLRTAI